jgi:hypothetical protein
MRRRIVQALGLAGLALVARAPRASAQHSVALGDAWTLTVAGNVNAFVVHERESPDGGVVSPYAIVGRTGRHGTTIRTGLLPAFLVLEVHGREGATDLGVHFGLAPQIQTPGGHDNDSSGTQAGARLDVRQVYLTVGGGWGRLLAGREVGLFGRQNYLTDQTLFGVGATGGNFAGPVGTTLGHTGSGALYPGFNAQVTWIAPARGPLGLSVGLFDPSANGDYTELDFPRAETELTWRTPRTLLWGGGLAQSERSPAADRHAVAWGVSAGAQQEAGPFTATLSGYLGRGIGTTSVFRGGTAAVVDGAGLRPSHGLLGQLAWHLPDGRTTVAAGYGLSRLAAAASEADFRIHNRSLSLGAYYQTTRSLKTVLEGTYARSEDATGAAANRSIVATAGLMLFF